MLDISLSVVNGIEATRKLRKEAPGTEVMIFALHHRETEVRDVLQAGTRGYVLKSEPDERLLPAVEGLAGHCAFFSDHLSKILLNNFLEHTGPEENRTPLTALEREVVQLIAEGNSNKKTADLLSISVKTVEAHRLALIRKLDVHSAAQLVRYAFREWLIQP